MENFLRTRIVHRGRTNHHGRSANDRRNIERLYARVDHADNPNVMSGNGGGNPRLTPQVGNPGFIAQFNIVVKALYFTVVANAWTSKTAAQILAAQASLATQLPVFMFGNSDYASGFKKMISQFPLSGWSYDTPFIYGADSGPGVSFAGAFSQLDSTAVAQLQRGDLIIPVTAVLGGVNYCAFSVIRCSQTGYGSLLDAINSDTFTMNMVRYTMSDETAASLAQYANQLTPVNLSIFGKFSSDQTDPNSFKIPEQQQGNIVDVPLVLDVTKQVCLGTYYNYDVPVQMILSFFVAEVTKA